MFAKYLMTSSLVAAIALSPIAIRPAEAQDAREVIGGLLLGGAILYGIAASQQPQPGVVQPAPQPGAQPAPQPTATYVPPRPAIPATEAGRQVQTALNYFGFDAGYVDGQVGPATRAAAARYQAALGYPVNGNSFPEDQAQYLIGAYRWATTGGQAQTGLSGTPLLVAFGTTQGGTVAPAVAGATGPGSNTTTIISGGPLPVPTASASGAGPVPNLFAGASGAPALSQRCDAVALQGQANGGMMTLSNLSNPGFALSEQFCIARASAVTQARDLTDAVPDLTQDQIRTQCLAFSDAVAGQTALIATTMPAQATTSAQGFAYSTGIPQPELAATARVCLGLGYAADDMQMALGAALVLVAVGEPAYGEMIAHHLREGFGVPADAYRANAWYETTLNAMLTGAPAVFSPADAGRLPLIRQAVAMTLAGQVVPRPTPVPAVTLRPAPGLVPTLQPAPLNVEADPEIVLAPLRVTQ